MTPIANNRSYLNSTFARPFAFDYAYSVSRSCYADFKALVAVYDKARGSLNHLFLYRFPT